MVFSHVAYSCVFLVSQSVIDFGQWLQTQGIHLEQWTAGVIFDLRRPDPWQMGSVSGLLVICGYANAFMRTPPGPLWHPFQTGELGLDYSAAALAVSLVTPLVSLFSALRTQSLIHIVSDAAHGPDGPTVGWVLAIPLAIYGLVVLARWRRGAAANGNGTLGQADDARNWTPFKLSFFGAYLFICYLLASPAVSQILNHHFVPKLAIGWVLTVPTLALLAMRYAQDMVERLRDSANGTLARGTLAGSSVSLGLFSLILAAFFAVLGETCR
jgi:hypothetical protein